MGGFGLPCTPPSRGTVGEKKAPKAGSSDGWEHRQARRARARSNRTCSSAAAAEKILVGAARSRRRGRDERAISPAPSRRPPLDDSADSSSGASGLDPAPRAGRPCSSTPRTAGARATGPTTRKRRAGRARGQIGSSPGPRPEDAAARPRATSTTTTAASTAIFDDDGDDLDGDGAAGVVRAATFPQGRGSPRPSARPRALRGRLRPRGRDGRGRGAGRARARASSTDDERQRGASSPGGVVAAARAQRALGTTDDATSRTAAEPRSRPRRGRREKTGAWRLLDGPPRCSRAAPSRAAPPPPHAAGDGA